MEVLDGRSQFVRVRSPRIYLVCECHITKEVSLCFNVRQRVDSTSVVVFDFKKYFANVTIIQFNKVRTRLVLLKPYQRVVDWYLRNNIRRYNVRVLERSRRRVILTLEVGRVFRHVHIQVLRGGALHRVKPVNLYFVGSRKRSGE